MMQPEKMELTSMDVAAQKREELKQALGAAFPEVFAEGSIDFDQLKRTLGQWAEPKSERFGLTWNGKSDCMKIIQQTSIAALKPIRTESVNFNETENLFIEGDNLEVLKLLQKAYFGKIKMIYIDPPYNTGGDFIYQDTFKDSLETYLSYTNQVDELGKKLSTNTDSSGRFHANWLNMMYPRLFVSKNLLKDDGVICISIGDHEVANLRLLCDHVFGEENFEGHIHWRRRHNQPNDPTKMIGLVAEHILVYAKDKETFKASGVGKVELTGNFTNPDNDLRGPWASKPWKVGSDQSGSRYKITTPTGETYDEEWMGDERNFKSLLDDGRIIFPDKGKGSPRKKYFQTEREEEGQSANNWWDCEHFGHNQEGNQILAELMDGIKNTFSNPKPPRLIRNLLSIANCKDGDTVLDFFLGSGTTFQAAFQYNHKLKLIGIQIPERLDESQKEHMPAIEFCEANDLKKTIAELSKERIRRAGAAMQSEESGQSQFDKSVQKDFGFRAFRLARSNFSVWNSESQDFDIAGKQLDLHVDHVATDSSHEDILYELLLKAGYPLTTKVENIELAGKAAFSISEGTLIICLEKEITPELIDAIVDANPERVICLDEGFKGNDQLKANAVQTFKARAQAEESEIVFRTV